MTVYGRDVSTKAEAGCVGCDFTSEGTPNACRIAARAHASEHEHVTFMRTVKTRLFKRQPDEAFEVELVERGTV